MNKFSAHFFYIPLDLNDLFDQYMNIVLITMLIIPRNY